MAWPIIVPTAVQVAPLIAVPAPPRGAQAEARTSCLPAAALKNAKIVSLSVYESNGPSMPFNLTGSNRSTLHSLAVTGRVAGPVVLVVSAYEPVLWDLSAVSDQVKGVVASGYYPQAVTGISSKVPVRFSSTVGSVSDLDTCGRIRYAYERTDDIQRQADEIIRGVGGHPWRFYGAYSTDTLPLDAPDPKPHTPAKFGNIRTSVPIVDSEDGANLPGPAPPYVPSSSRRLRFVEWNKDGLIVRDQGGPRVPDPEISARPYPAHSRSATPSFGTIFWIGLLALLGWKWRRSKARTIDALGWLGPDTPEYRVQHVPAPAVAVDRAYQKEIAALKELAAITDCAPLILALHRFGRELQSLRKTSFDSDLAAEVAAVVERHFDHAVGRYQQVRPSLQDADAEQADEALLNAVERLTLRLQELHGKQNGRDIAGVDEAARFIEARHPIT